MKKIVESIGKRTSHSIEELGYVSVLLVDTLVWLVMGKSRKQPVRAVHIFHEALHIGVFAIPIVIVLCFSVGMMLAMQGLETLKPYGA
ncbi:MAG: ABC transporter permease, partial [Gammaproteobacteria bacterium]|nr:ABC transporter permease [Gammaproteobacteria bacterium]